jgi:hypothetical protein
MGKHSLGSGLGCLLDPVVPSQVWVIVNDIQRR